MVRRRRVREEAPMPLSSAGLITFFEEETAGIKVDPKIVIGASILLILLVILARIVVFP